jgi:hypothetical protein
MPGNAGGAKGPDFWCAFEEGEVKVTRRRHRDLDAADTHAHEKTGSGLDGRGKQSRTGVNLVIHNAQGRRRATLRANAPSVVSK